MDPVTKPNQTSASESPSSAPQELAPSQVAEANPSAALSPTIINSPEVTDNESEPSEEDVRKTAYGFWESDGRPEGSHEEHWHRAREHHRKQRRGS